MQAERPLQVYRSCSEAQVKIAFFQMPDSQLGQLAFSQELQSPRHRDSLRSLQSGPDRLRPFQNTEDYHQALQVLIYLDFTRMCEPKIPFRISHRFSACSFACPRTLLQLRCQFPMIEAPSTGPHSEYADDLACVLLPSYSSIICTGDMLADRCTRPRI